MNFLDLAKVVLTESGISTNPPTAVEGQTGAVSKVLMWTARANKDIQLEKREWQFLWRMAQTNTVEGKDTYTLADLAIEDLRDLKAIYHQGQTVPFVEWQDWRRYATAHGQVGLSAGTPRYFTQRPDGNIVFYPTPSAAHALEIEYYRTPIELTEATDEPPFPVEFHDAVIFKALEYYSIHEDDQYRYQQALRQYDEWLSQLCADQLPKMDFL